MASTGVTVAVENMFPVRVGGREMTFHANQDLEELDGLPDIVLDTSMPRSPNTTWWRSAAVRRPDPPRAPVGQRR
jgi:hypothetical protein